MKTSIQVLTDGERRTGSPLAARNPGLRGSLGLKQPCSQALRGLYGLRPQLQGGEATAAGQRGPSPIPPPQNVNVDFPSPTLRPAEETTRRPLRPARRPDSLTTHRLHKAGPQCAGQPSLPTTSPTPPGCPAQGKPSPCLCQQRGRGGQAAIGAGQTLTPPDSATCADRALFPTLVTKAQGWLLKVGGFPHRPLKLRLVSGSGGTGC